MKWAVTWDFQHTRSLIRAFPSRLSESTLVKIPHCWISHVTAQIPLDSDRLKGRSGVYKEKLTSVLAFSVLHSSCEDLQELLWLISNLIGLSNKLWKWLTPLINSVTIWFYMSCHNMGYSTNTTNYRQLVKTDAIKFEFLKNFILDIFLYIEIFRKADQCYKSFSKLNK